MEENGVTFVCCVESGFLEDQTVRMIGSLRRFGGALAKSQIVAVTPRFGPPLHRMTRAFFDSLHVDYVRARQTNHRYAWFKFLNKPLSLLLAQDIAQSSTLCWLDSDVIVVAEPKRLNLGSDADIMACPVDKEMGSVGPGDRFEPIWQVILQANGLSTTSFPWTETCKEHIRIRLYWNGGVFAFRKSTMFAQEYLNTTFRSLDTLTVSRDRDYSLGLNEMSAIGIAAVKLGLRRHELPLSYNYTAGSFLPREWCSVERLASATIIHYHDAMWPHYWPKFMNQMEIAHPAAAIWLRQIGPMQNISSLTARFFTKALRIHRRIRERSYKARSHAV